MEQGGSPPAAKPSDKCRSWTGADSYHPAAKHGRKRPERNPRISSARLASTSFTFMFVLVPAPPCSRVHDDVLNELAFAQFGTGAFDGIGLGRIIRPMRPVRGSSGRRPASPCRRRGPVQDERDGGPAGNFPAPAPCGCRAALRRERQLTQRIPFDAKRLVHDLVGRATPCAPPIATKRMAGRGLPALPSRFNRTIVFKVHLDEHVAFVGAHPGHEVAGDVADGRFHELQVMIHMFLA